MQDASSVVFSHNAFSRPNVCSVDFSTAGIAPTSSPAIEARTQAATMLTRAIGPQWATSGVASAIHGALAGRHGTGPCVARRRWWRCPVIRAVNRGPHADKVLDADTRLAGRPSTVQNGRNRQVGRGPDPL